MTELKILSIGNSFSMDTMRRLDSIAWGMGVKKMKLWNLFVPGCSIERHYTHATEDIPAYVRYMNTGDGWSDVPNYKISDALAEGGWDWINIQHGSSGGSWYSVPSYYEKLPGLVEYVRQRAPGAGICFNLTWVGEPDHHHREIVAMNGDQLGAYQKIAALTQELILPMPGIDRVVPTGTAIQNARTAVKELLTRDGYHLSRGYGSYIAGLCFYAALTGEDISAVTWAPEDVTPEQKATAIAAVKAALETPFACTNIG